jgi:hypothetical protein
VSNSSFRAGLFLTVSAQTDLNWFLLSLQTAKPSDKKKYGPNISSSFDMMMSTSLKDTRR